MPSSTKSPSITNTVSSARVWLWAGVEPPAPIRVITVIPPPVDSEFRRTRIQTPGKSSGDQATADVSVFVWYTGELLRQTVRPFGGRRGGATRDARPPVKYTA